MSKKGKLIFAPQLAKWLLGKGFKVFDIKPHRDDREKTVFIFEYEEGLDDAMTEYTKRKER